MKSIRTVSLAVLPLMLGACSAGQKSSELDSSSVSGGISARLDLGQAFDADRAKWGNLSCVTGITRSDKGVTGDLEYRREMSYEETLKEISGGLQAGINFPSIAIEGKADYAARNSSSDFREVHSFMYKYRTRTKLETGSHTLTETGLKYANEPKWKLRDRCKDEFVNEIVYGAFYMANLSVEYKNKEDKQKFGGSVIVNGDKGKVEIAGRLALATEEVKRSVKIRLTATQEGGNPRLLSGVLTSDIVSCDAARLDVCMEGFKALIDYGRSFPVQIDGTDSLVVLSYNTESYADTGLDQLVAEEGDEVDDEVVDTRYSIETSLESVRQKLARADFIMANHATTLDDSQRDELILVQQGLKKNKALLSKALDFCYKNPYTVEGADGRRIVPCAGNLEETNLKLAIVREDLLNLPTAPGSSDTVVNEG